MPTLNIGGQRVKVGDEFMSLSPEQQSATVEEIASSLPKRMQAGPDDHGKARRNAMSVPEKIASPITEYPTVYGEMNKEARDQMGRGVDQLATAVAGDKPIIERNWEGLKGAGNVAMGALGYVASPINAAFRTQFGNPVEDATGIPREYTEFATQLATPGIGLTRMPARPGAPVNPANVQPQSVGGAPQSSSADAVTGYSALQAQERLRAAGHDVNVPRTITSDSIPMQRSGEHLSNIPFVGDPLKKAFHETVPQQLVTARDRLAAEYGAGSGPNVAHRAGNVLSDAAAAETRATGNAAQASDDAVMSAWQGAQDNTLRQIGQAETRSLEQARAAVGDMSPQDMGQALIARLRQGERAARAEKERLYGIAGQSDGAIRADAVRGLRGDVEKTLNDAGDIIDPTLTPAASRMMAELDRAPLNLSSNMGRRPDPLPREYVPQPVSPQPGARAVPNEPQAAQGQSLLEYLASKGGLGPDAELGAIGAERHIVNVEGAGRRKLVRQGGLPLDYAREAAQEAGYLRGKSTPRDLLDAIDAEMRGQKRFAEGFEGSVSKREAAARYDRERHDYDRFRHGLEQDLAEAGHGRLAPEARERALKLMENEKLDADAAATRALQELGQEDAAVRRNFPGGQVPPDPAVSVQAMEQTRKRLGAMSRAASNDADRRAASRVVKAYDDWLDNAFDSALFSGSDEALKSYKAARAANTEWRTRFGYNARDDADRIVNRIVTGEVTPQEVSNWLVGASQVGAKGSSSRMLTRIAEATQNDPEALQAIRGGVWNRLSQSTEGATAKAPEKIASSINEFLHGSGRDVAVRLFTPEQQELMRTHAATLRRGQTARELTAEVAKNTKPGSIEIEKGPMQQLADRVIGKGQKSDEALFSTIHGYAQKGGDVKALAGLLRQLPQSLKGDIAASFVRNLGQNRAGQFTPDQFATQWQNITPQAKAVLFGNAGEHVTALNDIATIAQRMKDVKGRYGNPSGTGQNSIFAALMGVLGGTVGLPAAAGTAAVSGAGYATAKVLASPAGASSLAKYARSVERNEMAPTPQTAAAVKMSSRNLVNTVKTLGAAHTAQLPAPARSLQGAVPARAQDEQR